MERRARSRDGRAVRRNEGAAWRDWDRRGQGYEPCRRDSVEAPGATIRTVRGATAGRSDGESVCRATEAAKATEDFRQLAGQGFEQIDRVLHEAWIHVQSAVYRRNGDVH